MPELARRVQDPAYRAPVLALAARYAKADDARALVQEAFAAGNAPMGMNAGPQMQARLASVALRFDPKLAAELAQKALHFDDDSRRQFNTGETAFYLGQVSPEDARALLETEWAQAQEIAARRAQNVAPLDPNIVSFEKGNLVLAMAPLDFERAVTWARTLEPKAYQLVLGRLARWALQTDEERELLRND